MEDNRTISAHALNTQVLLEALPDWARQGDPATRQALAESLVLSEHFQAQVAARLAAVQAAGVFCQPLFAQAFARRFRAAGDHGAHWLERGVVQPSWGSNQLPTQPTSGGLRYRRQSLLAAALHNFNGADARSSSLRLSASARGGVELPAFVGFCRELDLGTAYQTYLVGQLDQPQADVSLMSLMRRTSRHDFETVLHWARLHGRLPAALHAALVRVAKGHAPGRVQGLGQLICLQLSLLDVPLGEVLAFEVREQVLTGLPFSPSVIRQVVLYVPGDPADALFCFDDWDALMQDLHRRLAEPVFCQRIAAGVAHWALPGWLGRLQRRVFMPVERGQSGLGAYNPDGRLSFSTQVIEGHCLDALCAWRRDRVLANGRLHAVPTADIDQAEHSRRLEAAEALGLDLLGLAAFVVPGLGEVMLGVGVAQLMSTAYEGFKDWREGDRQEALACLAQGVGIVVTGLAVGAVVGAGSRFFAGLRPVWTDNGLRLWSNDLDGYGIPRPDGLSQAEYREGVYHLGDDRYISMDRRWYRVQQQPEGQWRLLHAREADAYAPRLLFNGADAWRLEAEEVAQWPEGGYRVRRLGGDAAMLEDAEAERVLRVAGVDPDTLAQWHQTGVRPSPAFEDSARRLLLDRQLTKWLQRLSTQPDDWSSLAPALPRLGIAAEPGQPLPAEVIDRLWDQRANLFEALDDLPETPEDRDLQPLLRAFPGVPRRVARRLVDEAGFDDRQRLIVEDRVPLALATRAHQQQAQIRLTRRLQGYYLSHAGEPQIPLAQALEEVAVARQRLTAVRTMFRPPLGANGRRGYLLGRASSLPLTRDGMVRQLRELYPDLSEHEAEESVRPYRHAPLGFLRMLERQRDELRLLQRQLYEWVRLSQPAVLSMYRDRSTFARALERGWRRQTLRVGYPQGRVRYSVSLEGLRVGALPALDARIEFSHVSELWLSDMGLGQIPAAFLERFTGLEVLDISRNALRQLPNLSSCAGLRSLRAGHNLLRIDPLTQGRLSQLTALHHLDLSGNPLLVPPGVGAFWHLRTLNLRHTGIDRLPAALHSRSQLVQADLRDNRIARLPAQLFDEGAALAGRVFLEGNPLERESLYRLETQVSLSAQRVSLLLGTANSTGITARRFWAGTDSAHLALWDRLVEPQDAQALYDLLDALRWSSEATPRRLPEFKARVWWLLERAGQDSALLADLYSLAGSETHCYDSVLSNWSNLHLRGLLHEALQAGSDETGALARLSLARGLFRLEQLEAIAEEDAQARGLAGESVEVSLAYRTGLAEILRLPGQPRSMIFSNIASVGRERLIQAQARVREAERGIAWPRFLAGRSFWIDYLKGHFVEEFTALADEFHAKTEAFSAENEGALLSFMNELKQQFEQREQVLIARLSERERVRLGAADPQPGTSRQP